MERRTEIALRAFQGVALATLFLLPPDARAQSPADTTSSAGEHQAIRVVKFLAGGAAGLGLHESGHLLFGLALDADPGLKSIHFGPIPFFAITHRSDLSPRAEFVVSSAGFWMQHASSEWLLTKRPALRNERAPFVKGVLAFNILNSVGYSAVAMAKAGPSERDTRAMAAALDIDERWVGAMVLAPAVLDAYRYYHPDSRWAVWSARAVKVGMVLLVFR